MSLTIELNVHLAHDDETGRWYVAESDIPGLRLDAESPAALIEKIQLAAPEMIELNCDEIIERHRALTHAPVRAKAKRPAVTYRPVFDSPMAACV